jgi:hypothetical protein
VNCISFSMTRTVLSVVSTSSELLDNHMTFSNVHWFALVKAMHLVSHTLLSHNKLGKSLIRHVNTISGRMGNNLATSRLPTDRIFHLAYHFITNP